MTSTASRSTLTPTRTTIRTHCSTTGRSRPSRSTPRRAWAGLAPGRRGPDSPGRRPADLDDGRPEGTWPPDRGVRDLPDLRDRSAADRTRRGQPAGRPEGRPTAERRRRRRDGAHPHLRRLKRSPEQPIAVQVVLHAVDPQLPSTRTADAERPVV